MADFEYISINTTAEKLEKIANMEINDEVLDENSNDNSLPTSKLVYNELKKISENSGGGSNGGLGNLSIWQPNTEYKVGDWVLAQFVEEYSPADETSSFQYIVGLMCIKNHISPIAERPDLADDFYECWDKIEFNAAWAFMAACDGNGNVIVSTYATKEEVGDIETALDNIINIQNSILGFPEAEETTF